jgi:hypothetical protein
MNREKNWRLILTGVLVFTMVVISSVTALAQQETIKICSAMPI